MVADVIALVVCPFLPSIFFFKQILNQPPSTGQTKIFSAFSYCLAWSNTKLSGSASDDGRCALSESVWPNFCSLRADGQRSRPRHYLTFGLVYSSFVLYQKRKFMIGFIPSLPRKIIKKIINVCSLSELFRWIGLFWSALHSFHARSALLLSLLSPLFMQNKRRRKKKCPKWNIVVIPFSPLWICIPSARVTTGGDYADKPSSFLQIQFTIIYNYYYHWKPISSHILFVHIVQSTSFS